MVNGLKIAPVFPLIFYNFSKIIADFWLSIQPFTSLQNAESFIDRRVSFYGLELIVFNQQIKGFWG